MKTRSLLLLPLLLALSACAQSYYDLAPFPCAETGECPDGLYCSARGECSILPPNTTCQSTADCEGRYPSSEGITCVDGVCASACTGLKACPSGRACITTYTLSSYGYSDEVDVCLQECDESKPCPTNTRCNIVGEDNRKVCTGR